jgi:hypothetical protein
VSLATGAWLMGAVAASAATPPELPRVYLDTSEIAPTGRTIQVAAGGDLQGALNSAQPGDLISLQAGATFVGPFTLPQKSGTGWIIVRTSSPDSSLPPFGQRIRPSFAPQLARIVTPTSEPALMTAPGAHHYRFIGIEFALQTGTTFAYELVRLGEGGPPQTTTASIPHNLIFDRVYAHGTPTSELRRCFTLNSASTAIINSHLSDCHQTGVDSQAIGGWNGPGPFKIANNYLEGAGENLIFGGADPSIPNLVPSDIEIRGNHFYKPVSWKIGHAQYGGIPWGVKNLLELKNAQRVLIIGNVFEHNWPHAQNGFAILFTVRNQDGMAPWSVVKDITFRFNVVRRVAAVFNIHRTDDLQSSQPTERILIEHNLYHDVGTPEWGGSGILLQPNGGLIDLAFNHNTGFQGTHIIAAGPSGGPGAVRFAFNNNIALNNEFGVGGDGTYGSPLTTLSTYFPGAEFLKNAIIGGASSNYPPSNFFPANMGAVGFLNHAAGDYRLAPGSPYKNAATDGTDVGANIGELNANTAGAVTGESPAVPSAPTNLRIVR